MHRWIPLLALLVFASPAFGTDNVMNSAPGANGCSVWTLCDGETASQVCDSVGDGTGNALVIRAGNEYSWTAFAHDSSETTGPWEIKIYGNAPGQGFGSDGLPRTLLNSTDMDESNMLFSWSGIMGDIHAVTSGTEGTGVTLVVKGCPLTK